MATSSANASSAKKQAVVVIHGMGEQRPMDTIREFVTHVWKQDPNLTYPHFWNKPSSVSESFEQRRLTTDRTQASGKEEPVQRTDFFEYYWAHRTVGTKWEHFWGWISALLFCLPSRYDNHASTLKPLWFILWGLIVFGFFLALWWRDIFSSSDDLSGLTLTFVTVASAGWAFLVAKARSFFTHYFGDVARYIQAKPANIAIRQAIRQGGVELLERIHQTGDYDRIVLVGHSLGSYVAYDILTHLWARHNKFKDHDDIPTPLSEASREHCNALTELAKSCGTDAFDADTYWQTQRQLFSSLIENDPDKNWLISDFITLGSPLTYADVLLYKNQENFEKRKLDRELPTSPPLTEHGAWYYGGDGEYYLHHGAVFGAVKWTNIYMPHGCYIKGDLISGPVSLNYSFEAFDVANGTMTPPCDMSKTPIEEIALDYSKIKDGFTHTAYWKSAEVPSDNEHLAVLRKAVGLY